MFACGLDRTRKGFREPRAPPGTCFYAEFALSGAKKQVALLCKTQRLEVDGTFTQLQPPRLSPHMHQLLKTLRPTPLSREIVFHSGNGNCTIVSQPCFTTRNLRTKLCGIRSQTEEQEFVDPFKSWYLETLSISEMENRRASPGPRLGEGLN